MEDILNKILSIFEHWQVILIIGLVASYFFKSYIIDLVTRFFQIFIKPLDIIKEQLKHSEYSTVGLNFTNLILNLVLVLMAILMVMSEFSTLREVLNTLFKTGVGTAAENGSKTDFFGSNINSSTLGAITYISIATILGLIGFELINIKRLLAGILFKGYETKRKKVVVWKIIIGSLALFGMLWLAYYQGKLSNFRYDVSYFEHVTVSPENEAISDNVEFSVFRQMPEKIREESYNTFVKFSFILGFLTPVIAAIGLLSLDIYIAVFLLLIVFIIDLLQIFLVSIQYFIEAIVNVSASLIVKVFELFGKFIKENAPKNASEKNMLSNFAPLKNNQNVYLRNESDKYQKFFRVKKFIIHSLEPAFSEVFPAQKIPEFKLTKETTLEDIAEIIWNIHHDGLKHLFASYSDITFFYFDMEGRQIQVQQNSFLYEFPIITNTFYLQKQIEIEATPTHIITALNFIFSKIKNIRNNNSKGSKKS